MEFLNNFNEIILNNTKCDAIFDQDSDGVERIEEDVHIWVKQRTGRKYMTEVEGLAPDLNLKKIIKCWRKEFHCSVTKTRNNKGNRIIKLQGDKRDLILNFLLDEQIIDKEKIKMHGF